MPVEKFGRCPYCIGGSLVAALVFWTLYAVITTDVFVQNALMSIAIFATVLAGTHLVSLGMRLTQPRRWEAMFGEARG